MEPTDLNQFIKRRGRPKAISAQLEQYLKLYFDPICGQNYICQSLGISKAAFYRYEKELNAPKVRIGIGTHLRLPKKMVINRLKQWPHSWYDLQMARAICKTLGVRGTLLFSESRKVCHLAHLGRLDFALASVAWTREKEQYLCFSKPYISKESPNGTIVKKKQIELKTPRPSLGVIKNNVHHQFAVKNLGREYSIKTFHSTNHWFHAFDKGLVDTVLLYSGLMKSPQFNLFIDKLSPRFNYENSFSAIVTGKKKQHWIGLINYAVERILDSSLICESDFFE